MPNATLDRIPEQKPETEQPLAEESFPPQPPASRWSWKRLPRNAKIAGGILLGLFAIAVTGTCVAYVRLSRMADTRLADGPFSSSIDIYTSPETLWPGDPIAKEDLARKLERSGYSHTVNDPNGWFSMEPNGVLIHPAADSAAGPVRVQFNGPKVSSIVSLTDRSPRQNYELSPELITNLSAAREKRRLVRYADIPPVLVKALTAVEDKRFFSHGGVDLKRIVK